MEITALLPKEVVQKELADSRLAGAVRGFLVGISAQGEPIIDFYGNSTGRQLIAVTTVAIRVEDVGKEAILLFEDGDLTRPLLVGLVQNPSGSQDGTKNTVDLKVDGRHVTLTADQEICLRCGDASITLTRAGKILIKGTYLLSKSSGANRIKGGSVQLN